MSSNSRRISVIDSHTGGEPTRVVIGGAPDVGGGSIKQRLPGFLDHADFLRPALLGEPRGFGAMVGALLCDSGLQECICGVIFFNNSGLLNSCLHGTMGLVKTLEFTGRITFGEHCIETPVGVVTATLNPDGSVTVANVPSYRYREAVAVEVPGWGKVLGDVAWGGNWFFLVEGRLNIPSRNGKSISCEESCEGSCEGSGEGSCEAGTTILWRKLRRKLRKKR